MSDIQKQFFAKASVMAGDLEHKRKIAFNIDKYNDSFNKGKLQFANLELAKRKAKNYKWRAIEYLEHNLVQFENNFTNNGGKVLWAEDAEEAQELILEICRLNETDTVVKAKSMVTEEIGLNKLLHENDIDVVET
ncbi:MAG: lactate utilization protein, partial [Chitinophagia bacterium]|nr:lactate utilization protein [Chitinophagia bacterium]